MFTVRVVSLEEELRMSEETVRTLQAGRQQNGPSSLQYMGSSKDGGEVTEGRIEALAMALSEAAIAKGKTGIRKLEQACPKIVLFSVVTSTILSCQGKWKSFRPLWRRREDRSGPCKVSEYTHKLVSYGTVKVCCSTSLQLRLEPEGSVVRNRTAVHTRTGAAVQVIAPPWVTVHV